MEGLSGCKLYELYTDDGGQLMDSLRVAAITSKKATKCL